MFGPVTKIAAPEKFCKISGLRGAPEGGPGPGAGIEIRRGFVERYRPETRMNSAFEPPDRAPAREILTVSQLNRAVAGLLERSVPPVLVSGEVSNFVRAASGHWYFTLKDPGAQVRAVMFRGRAQYVDFAPRDGDRVEVRAQVTLYEPRGDYQLAVEAMRRAGTGDLWQRFQQLRDRLQREGLFDEQRKRTPPRLPRRIGVITSPQAAALRDVLTTLARRAPQIPVVLYPSPVQGADAPAALVSALRAANRRAECDVLLLVRGGGSIEDLWAFNDEALARAIAASELPVICGVGHETDFTIADFVADVRAPTPTAAAAAAAPDRLELAAGAAQLARRLQQGLERRLDAAAQRIDTSARLLRPPSAQWQARAARLAEASRRLAAAAASALERRAAAAARLQGRLRPPRAELAAGRLDAAAARLRIAAASAASGAGQRLERAVAALELVSPSAVLERGYAIVRDDTGAIVRSAAQVRAGQPVSITVSRGEIDAEVRATRGG